MAHLTPTITIIIIIIIIIIILLYNYVTHTHTPIPLTNYKDNSIILINNYPHVCIYMYIIITWFCGL